MRQIFRTGTKMKQCSWLLLVLCVAMFPVVGLGGPPDGSPRGHGGGGGGGGGRGSGGDVSFGGRATVVDATALGIQIVISDTGPLPPSGGAREASLLEAEVPGLLTAEVLPASTIGQGDRTRSEASVANLNLTVGRNTISADFLMARAQAVCGPTVSGSSEVVGLVINGQAITVTGEPNQTVKLPAGTGRVVINEQSSSPDNSDITVNALHVVGDGVADVVISSAHAEVTCTGQPICDGGDFVTGGGWINLPSGARGNFGVAGGFKGGAFWGHLVYMDRGNNVKVKGTGVTAYTDTGTTMRHIEGNCEGAGCTTTYLVDVADNGEPGRGDTFAIALPPGGHDASGTLAGGNIQLHRPCQ